MSIMIAGIITNRSPGKTNRAMVTITVRVKAWKTPTQCSMIHEKGSHRAPGFVRTDPRLPDDDETDAEDRARADEEDP